MRKYKFSLMFVVILIGLILLPGVLSFGIKRIPDAAQPSLKNVYPVFGEQTIAQTFTAKDDNLSGVGMSIKNPNLQNTKELVMSLKDENGVELRSVSKFGSTIPDGNFVNFDFAPIADSANKQFSVVLSAQTAVEEDALEVFLTDQPNERLNGLMLGNEVGFGSAISMTSFYKPSSFVGMPLVIYGDWFGRLFSDVLFAGMYVITLGALGVYLFILEKRR